jgi:hypothetical protein
MALSSADDLAGILPDVVDSIMRDAAQLGDRECRPDRLRLALWMVLPAGVLEVTASSFFLVSTEIAGSLTASAAVTCRLM